MRGSLNKFQLATYKHKIGHQRFSKIVIKVVLEDVCLALPQNQRLNFVFNISVAVKLSKVHNQIY